MTRRLGDLTWQEVPGSSLLVVPTGSCEQHGPHLPLDTDLRIADALAESLAVSRPDVVVAPPLAVGASGEHESFPGTLSIGTPTLEGVVVELARSALPPAGSDRPTPFAGVLFVNGHGGNLDAFAAAIGLLAEEGRAVDVWHPRVPGGDSHAGRTETSLLLHLDPSCVRTDRIAVGSTRRWHEIGALVRAEGLASVSESGVLGDPTAATAAEGERVFSALVEDLSVAADRLTSRIASQR